MNQEVVLWILSGLILIIGWFSSRKIMALERADEVHIAEISNLKELNSTLKISIAEQNYVRHRDLDEKFDKLDGKLEKIFEKLNAKADK